MHSMNSARAITAETGLRQLVVFDGECPLCRRAVRALLRLEAAPVTGLVTLQSSLGHRLGEHFGENADALDSVWLIRDGALYRDSEALWRCAEEFKRPWAFISALRFLPRPLRDGVYQIIGRFRRYLATDPGEVASERLLTELDDADCRTLDLPLSLAGSP